MSSELLDCYRESWVARWQQRSSGEGVEVNRPGLHGFLGSAEHPRMVMLVTDDRSYEWLHDVLQSAPVGTIQISTTAPRSLALLEDDLTWVASTSTGMVCRAIARAPAASLPVPRRVRGVFRGVCSTDQDRPDRVPLDAAVACAVRAAPQEDPDGLAAFLSAGPTIRLFAAVDAQGDVTATSGYELTGDQARVLFVNTDPAWQRRGIGTAMVSAALLGAQRRGARAASLDASDRGTSVYRRLGFATVGPIVRFRR